MALDLQMQVGASNATAHSECNPGVPEVLRTPKITTIKREVASNDRHLERSRKK